MNIQQFVGQYHPTALDAACASQIGAKYLGSNGRIGVWYNINLDDTAQPADIIAAQTVGNTHDPVFLSVDKTTIQANGTDAATVTVKAPSPNAAAVTLSVSVNGGASQDWPITLTNGVGTDTITSLDPATIVVTVKNGTNRSTDTISIKAQ